MNLRRDNNSNNSNNTNDNINNKNQSIVSSTAQFESIDYGLPSSYFVFIVGHCEEWPEDRNVQGDIGLYNEFLRSGVPEHQTVLLKDKDCTKSNCEEKLFQFLRTTRPGSTLIFSYQGHGKTTGFATIECIWQYHSVVEMIEQYFHGERVLFLIDCCSSGAIITWVAPPYVRKKQYVCLCTSPPYIETSDEGDEWVMNMAWIHSLRYCCNNNNINNSSSSSNNNNNNKIKEETSIIPTLSQIIEYIADRTVMMMWDQYVTYVSDDVDVTANDWLPRRESGNHHHNNKNNKHNKKKHNKGLTMPQLELNLPSDARLSSSSSSSVAAMNQWNVGDYVYYKHKGGYIHNIETKTTTNNNNNNIIINNNNNKSLRRYMAPGWYYSVILSSDNKGYMNLKVHCSYDTQIYWIVHHISQHELMNEFYLCQVYMISDELEEIQVFLAKRLQYITFSISAHTIIHVIQSNKKIEEEERGATTTTTKTTTTEQAMVVDWRVFDWGDCLQNLKENNNNNFSNVRGAHVPIRWLKSGQEELIPLGRIEEPTFDDDDDRDVTTKFLHQQQRQSIITIDPEKEEEEGEDQDGKEEICARRALIKSIESSGKILCNVQEELGTNKIMAYCAEDDEWYDAIPLDVETVSLETLATHVEFRPLEGKYCPLRYKDDDEGDEVLSPLLYVRRRQ